MKFCSDFEKINRYNYSPLEQLILAYDLIRDRFYVREGEDEDYNVSASGKKPYLLALIV